MKIEREGYVFEISDEFLNKFGEIVLRKAKDYLPPKPKIPYAEDNRFNIPISGKKTLTF